MKLGQGISSFLFLVYSNVVDTRKFPLAFGSISLKIKFTCEQAHYDEQFTALMSKSSSF